MTESLGTRDVLEQVDTRLGNVEQDLRQFRTGASAGRQEATRNQGCRQEVQPGQGHGAAVV